MTQNESMAKHRIALLGGAFDPPHCGHLMIASQVLRSGDFDQLWFIPTGDDRYDRVPHANAVHRREMLSLALRPFQPDQVKIVADQIDGKLPGSYTIDLIQSLKRADPQTEFLFIVGADRVLSLPEWRDFSELVKSMKFLVVPRAGEILPVRLPSYIEVLNVDPLYSTNASSSGIRKLIREGQLTVGLVPESVGSYIREHKLYQA